MVVSSVVAVVLSARDQVLGIQPLDQDQEVGLLTDRVVGVEGKKGQARLFAPAASYGVRRVRTNWVVGQVWKHRAPELGIFQLAPLDRRKLRD